MFSSRTRPKDEVDWRTHPAIPWLVLGSIILTPYILIRGRLGTLRSELDLTRASNAGLLKKVKDLAEQKQPQRVVALLEETKGSIERLTAFAEEERRARMEAGVRVDSELRGIRRTLERMEADAVQRDHARAEWEKLRRHDFKVLLQDNQRARAHLFALKELGTSLADVAAFMHEVELQQGYTPRKGDGRGIERIRRLAKTLEELPTASEDTELKETRASRTQSDSDPTPSHANPRKT